MFGRESTGIPLEILKDNFSNCLRIPMTSKSRSLNLANSVSIVSYEIMRQLSFEGLSKFEVQKGKD
jgi:tRNA (cytidine/uridine-2'-O-)-methyltransferase